MLTLGTSRKSVPSQVFKSSARVGAELHERAFRRLGGAVRMVVLDNLKEGVLKPDAYDLAPNPLYREVLRHYGEVALPARAGDSDRNARWSAESGTPHAAQGPALREPGGGTSLPGPQGGTLVRRIRGTNKRRVSAMFAEEKPLQLP